jgi:hypothetical protein
MFVVGWLHEELYAESGSRKDAEKFTGEICFFLEEEDDTSGFHSRGNNCG